MPDQYENLRRILVGATYCESDVAVDVQVNRTAERAIDVVRRMVRNGAELDTMVRGASTIGDVREIIAKLEAIAEEETREALKLTP
jgi:hypothetical protein